MEKLTSEERFNFDSDVNSEDDSEIESSSSEDESSSGDDSEEECDMLELLHDTLDGPNAGPSAGRSGSGGGKVTMSDLLRPISDDGDQAKKLEKAVSSLGKAKTVRAVDNEVLLSRVERKLAYKEASKDIAAWTSAVKTNREAETLDFRNKERIRATTASMTSSFEPTTQFEKDVQRALEKCNAVDEREMDRLEKERMLSKGGKGGKGVKVGKRRRSASLGSQDSEAWDSEEDGDDYDDDDDLGYDKSLTLKSLKERYGKLAKMRSLMFYHQRKRHMINKIKSKKYRKIRSKQKERREAKERETLAETDPEAAAALDEKEATERMRERMSLAHKNTSKWAKRQLRRSSNIDTDTRRALSQQILMGDRLAKKQGVYDGDVDGDGESDQDNSDIDDDVDCQAAAKKILSECDDKDRVLDDKVAKNSNLFNLEFMKRGMEKQRDLAKKEAAQLLKEVEEMQAADESSDEEREGERSEEFNQPPSEDEGEGEGEVEEARKEKTVSFFGGSDDDDDDDDDDGGDENENDGGGDGDDGNDNDNDYSGNDDDDHNGGGGGLGKKGKKGRKQNERENGTSSCFDISTDSNPWMNKAKKASKGSKGSKGSNQGGVSSDQSDGKKKQGGPVVDVEIGVKLMSATDATETKNDKGGQGVVIDEGDWKNNVDGHLGKSEEEDGEGGLESMTQESLVAKAFAGPTDLEEEFMSQKRKAADAENGKSAGKGEGEDELAGWGSWAGSGVKKRKRARTTKAVDVPKRKAAAQSEQPRKDAKLPLVVINEKKAKKSARFRVAEVPYPFTSVEQYEKAMRGAIGSEWQTANSTKELTRPEVYLQSGAIIKPISSKAKAKPRRRS